MAASRYLIGYVLLAITHGVLSWENLPNIPSGKRSQYFLLEEDGGYKYGYDTGSDYFAKQSGDAQNQVSGHYSYKGPSGKDIDLKYTAGVQGFVPEGLEELQAQLRAGPSVPVAPVQAYSYPAPAPYSHGPSDDEANSGDASYSFTIDTDSYKRQESSDASGNVQGRYSYTNKAGQHDLSYIAGSNTGFVATSGSLSLPNGIGDIGPSGRALSGSPSAGSHPSSGFPSSGYPSSGSSFGRSSSPSAASPVVPNGDGSYSFEYSTNDHSRQESSDASGNVMGRYSFTNEAGQHDLSYVAGSATGFMPTGGSLSFPNGLSGRSSPVPSAPSAPTAYLPPTSYSSASASEDDQANTGDASYSFSIDTDEYKRHESSDAQGNVQGSYSYKNAAGSHDLSYVAGSGTGFVATSGSLSLPNGIAGGAPSSIPPASSAYLPPQAPSSRIGSSEDDQANTGDASYSFTIDTDEYKRQESSDASGNVQGKYSYTNKDGSHDLSYIAGSQTGFVATSGSLSIPNGVSPSVSAKYAAPAPVSSGYLPPASSRSSGSEDESSSGDASYSFTIDTADYQRKESSDASGNVQGSFSYRNPAGSHDLSFVAGSSTGFLPTGGSLSIAPGVPESLLRSAPAPAPLTKSSFSSSHNSLDNIAVKTYLPPSSSKKYGYIF